MSYVAVRSKDDDETLKNKVEKAVGGTVSITERAGGERVVNLSGDQLKKLNAMPLEDRKTALGGSVRQNLND